MSDSSAPDIRHLVQEALQQQLDDKYIKQADVRESVNSKLERQDRDKQASKKEVNSILYALEKQGVVERKTGSQPPQWRCKSPSNDDVEKKNQPEQEFPAQILREPFTHIEYLKSGHFGDIFKAQYEGKTVVLKVTKGKMSVSDYKELLSSLTIHPHPNVVSCIGLCARLVDEGLPKGKPALCFRYESGGDLLNYLKQLKKPLTAAKAQPIAIGMARGVAHLHDQNIIHRDIAPENFLVSQNKRILISDFGMARITENGEYEYENQKAFRTVRFPPEHWGILEEEITYKTALDVWMFGICLWELWNPGRIQQVRSTKNDKNKFVDYLIEACPAEFQEVIRKCLHLDPAQRPTMRQIVADLQEINSSA